MKNTIDIEVKREQTYIDKLIYDIQYGHINNKLGRETATELCRKIKIAAIADAENIRRDANFAVNKLSEALERTTWIIKDKDAFIKELFCREPRRNCERFNSGNPTKDREDAWKVYLETRDDGADDFERWLFESIAPKISIDDMPKIMPLAERQEGGAK